MEKDLRQLYPGKDRKEIVTDYYVKKIALALTIGVFGVMLAVAMGIKAGTDKAVKEGVVLRGNIQEEPVELELSTVLENGETESFSVMVEPRRLTGEEAESLYETFVQELPELFLGENTSLDMVCKDLVLEEQYAAYPFTVEWRSDRPDVLTGSGRVKLVEDSVWVVLYANISYKELIWEKEFLIGVVPENLPSREKEIKELTELLRASEEAGRENAEWYLPKQYQGREITWEQVQQNNSMVVVAGAIGVAVLIFFLGDKDLHDELEKKRKRMNRAYPDIVQKLALYLGAGLTVRAALQRLAAEGMTDASNLGKEVAEEIGYTCREIQSGVSEGIAYEHLAKRIGTKEYLRLGTLLVQNLKKGNSTLLQRLREEAERSALESLQNCRKLGEEASTKLLVPMVLFLLVVMVMIMLPAFSSMGM